MKVDLKVASDQEKYINSSIVDDFFRILSNETFTMALECFNLAFKESKDKVSYFNSKYLEHKTSGDPIIIPLHKDGQTGHWYGILIKENKFIV